MLGSLDAKVSGLLHSWLTGLQALRTAGSPDDGIPGLVHARMMRSRLGTRFAGWRDSRTTLDPACRGSPNPRIARSLDNGETGVLYSRT